MLPAPGKQKWTYVSLRPAWVYIESFRSVRQYSKHGRFSSFLNGGWLLLALKHMWMLIHGRSVSVASNSFMIKGKP